MELQDLLSALHSLNPLKWEISNISLYVPVTVTGNETVIFEQYVYSINRRHDYYFEHRIHSYLISMTAKGGVVIALDFLLIRLCCETATVIQDLIWALVSNYVTDTRLLALIIGFKNGNLNVRRLVKEMGKAKRTGVVVSDKHYEIDAGTHFI